MTDSARPVVDAILVTYRRTEELVASYRAAIEQSVPPRTLVVVDNSPDPTAAKALAGLDTGPSTRIEVVHPGANLGPAGAQDAGLRYLREQIDELDWVLILDDDDPLPTATVIEQLLDVLVSAGDDRVGGVALMGMRFVRPSLLLGGPVDVDGAEVVEPDALLGWASPIYRAAALDDVGGFRPELFWADEDVEMGLRMRRGGWRLLVAAAAFRGLPQVPDKVPREPRVALVPPAARDYYSLRNRIHIGRLYFPVRSVLGAIAVRGVLKPVINLPRHPVWASQTLRLNARAVIDGVRGRLGSPIPLRGETRAHRGSGRGKSRLGKRLAGFVIRDDGPIGRTGRWLRRTLWRRGWVYKDRAAVLSLLPGRGVGAEIGVHCGDFSAELLEHARPRRLHLIDPWRYEESPVHAGTWHGGEAGRGPRNTDRRYRGVVARFKRQMQAGTVIVHRAPSQAAAAQIADDSLDWVYVDGDHTYEAVRADIEAYLPKLRPGGVMAGNDYGAEGGMREGVLPAVDELVAGGNVEVLHLSVEDNQWAIRVPG